MHPVLNHLPAPIGAAIQPIMGHDHITEIRLRAHQPVILHMGQAEAILPCTATPGDIAHTMEQVSQHSLYAFLPQLKEGYLTLPGGHRVGIAGQAVVEQGQVTTWQYITGINIRIAHSVVGCGDRVIHHVVSGPSIRHTLIISPPGYGKTTLLRDLVRQLSHRGLTIGLADERGEIAGPYMGVPQHDLGPRTDVMTNCPKPLAINMLLRTMAPQVVALDEMATQPEVDAVNQAVNQGVKLMATAHGRNLAEVKKNPILEAAIHQGVFERFIVLGKQFAPTIL